MQERYRVEVRDPPTPRQPRRLDGLTPRTPYNAFHEAVPDNKVALAGAIFDDYHDDIADALSAGKTGVLMQQPYSDPAAVDGRPRRRLPGRHDPAARGAGAVLAQRNYL